MKSSKEKLGKGNLEGLIKLLPFISAAIGGGALWYMWFKYLDLINQSGVQWYEWTRPGFMLVMGTLCLLATILFIMDSPSGWSVFMGGLSMVPLMLFTNLVILGFRVIQSIFQGNAQPFLARLFTEPDNLIIPIVVIAFILLSSLSKRDTYKNSNNEIG